MQHNESNSHQPEQTLELLSQKYFLTEFKEDIGPCKQQRLWTHFWLHTVERASLSDKVYLNDLYFKRKKKKKLSCVSV